MTFNIWVELISGFCWAACSLCLYKIGWYKGAVHELKERKIYFDKMVANNEAIWKELKSKPCPHCGIPPIILQPGKKKFHGPKES